MGKNVLANILNYPETNNILNWSLTPDLKVTLEKLNSSESISIAHVISSLITANRSQLPFFLVSQEQLKPLLEGLITLIGVLLKPIPKEKLESISNI